MSDINNVYGICRVGRDPAPRLWATLYIVFGINCCPSSGNSVQYVWAPIMRHPHVDLPNHGVHLLIFPEIWFTVSIKSPKQWRNSSASSSSGSPFYWLTCDPVQWNSWGPMPFSDYYFFINAIRVASYAWLSKKNHCTSSENSILSSLFTASSLRSWFSFLKKFLFYLMDVWPGMKTRFRGWDNHLAEGVGQGFFVA